VRRRLGDPGETRQPADGDCWATYSVARPVVTIADPSGDLLHYSAVAHRLDAWRDAWLCLLSSSLGADEAAVGFRAAIDSRVTVRRGG